MNSITPSSIDEIFRALASQIRVAGRGPVHLVVIGGSVEPIDPIPDWLVVAAEKVGRDLDLPAGWLNNGPTSQLKTGLPDGFASRLVRRDYGPFLAVSFAGRYDQIHFKLYATIDHSGDRGGYHVQDLAALAPTENELTAAANWVLTQDVSLPFRALLKDFLEKQGHGVVAARLP